MNPRRIPLTLRTAVGVACAALIGLAPAARADGPDPFEDLFGDTGINAWTPAADASLLSSDPTEAANLDASVENFLSIIGPTGDNEFSVLVDQVDPNAFSFDPSLLYDVYDFPGPDFPTDVDGDFALGLDYVLFATGIGPVLDPVIQDLGAISQIPDIILTFLLFPGLFLLG